eukprot:TRINITY_DN32387_c0_g1_i1.p1 TRINITY_DN32387_c0_g1~~TRINITY_DN32387_c0_g1_i1.p1  ORF type:complete len:695 (+),score=82.60 TRINITY_DN32387_c0_g1_i1:44-2086(+)
MAASVAARFPAGSPASAGQEGRVSQELSHSPGVAQNCVGNHLGENEQSLARHTTSWVGEELDRAHAETRELLDQITGEFGDVVRDAAAYGESTLTFKDVSFSIRLPGQPPGIVLSPICGHFEPGTLVAIMGPSGCGKTTLLDILAEKKTSPYTGIVHFNGRPRDKLFRRMTAYVPQNDVIPANLTVEEAIRFHHDLKEVRPSKVKGDILDREISNRLDLLGLLEVRHSLIGDAKLRGISGGQKQRVSLARGFASGAQIIFCDEPTSGLSATDAESCIKYMRLISHKFGVTILVVIHQPRYEAARLFDHLLLLTSNPGRAVFNGPMSDATSHLEQLGHAIPDGVNPTDFFLDLVTPGLPASCGDDLAEHYRSFCAPSIAEIVDQQLDVFGKTALQLLEVRRQKMLPYGLVPPVRGSVYGVGFGRQLHLVFVRQLKLGLRDKQGVFAEMVGALAKALVIGVAYFGIGSKEPHQMMGFIFMLLNSVAIDGIKIIPRMIDERLVMKMESSEALYSQWVYIIAFTLYNSILTLFANSVFVIILFWMSSIRSALLWSIMAWTITLQVVFESLYLMVGAVAKDAFSAQMMALPFLMVFVIYNGYTSTVTTVPESMHWAIKSSPMAYGMEALSMDFADVYDNPGWNHIIEMNGYKRQAGKAFVFLLTTIAVFRTCHVACLRCMNNIKR